MVEHILTIHGESFIDDIFLFVEQSIHEFEVHGIPSSELRIAIPEFLMYVINNRLRESHRLINVNSEVMFGVKIQDNWEEGIRVFCVKQAVANHRDFPNCFLKVG